MVPTLLHVFPSFAVGGSQARFSVVANRLGRRFRHVVVAMDGREDCREKLDPGLDIRFATPALRPRNTLGNWRRFRTLLRGVRPHRLITHNWGSIECAMANWPGFTRHVHIEDGFGPEEANGQLPRRVLTRRYVLSRSTVVLPSQTLYALAENVWRLRPSVLRYVPNGVDCARFGAPDIVPYAWDGEGPVIGTVAALRPEKNLIRLLDAFRDVRARLPCRLLIAGDGPERARLEAHAAALDIAHDVRFAGHVRATATIYAAMSVLALSSDTEQMPTAVLEAMASGLPVVSTNVGDVLAMVSAENQPFVTRRDAGDLAQGLLQLLSDPSAAAQIGAANRAKACREYTEDRMVAAYESLYGGAS
jgi:glycosyltransferase involved in cell wall biosynthesis